MPRFVYVNGRYARYSDASVPVEDRGYQFADGVYEVIAVEAGEFVDLDRHLRRLTRSLGELHIAAPMSERSLIAIMKRLLRLETIRNGSIYVQITRGVAPRDFAFPKAAAPSLVCIARRAKPAKPGLFDEGVSVITIPDRRWARRDIKSIALLPAALGKQEAVEAGAYEAWQLDGENRITEGTSSNAWIVTSAGRVVTRAPAHEILNGVTRLAVLDLCRKFGLEVDERGFTRDEVLAAAEAFVTSTTSTVVPVVRLDGERIGEGRPGPVTRRLLAAYRQHASSFAGDPAS